MFVEHDWVGSEFEYEVGVDLTDKEPLLGYKILGNHGTDIISRDPLYTIRLKNRMDLYDIAVVFQRISNKIFAELAKEANE